MLDGSSQVITNAHRGGVGNTIDLYTPDNKLVSRVRQNADGSRTTTLFRPGRSAVTVVEKDGHAVADVDGHKLAVPDNASIVSSLANGGMSALEPKVVEHPMLRTVEQIERVKLGTKLAGPALTIIGTAAAVARAENAHGICVAGVAGGVGLAGDLSLAAVMPESAGMLARGASAMGGSLVFGSIG